MKKCRDCLVEKLPDAFLASRTCADRLRPECKDCFNATQRANYKNNKTEILAKQRRAREADPGKHRIRGREYYKTHKKKVCARTAAYQSANPALAAIYGRAYRLKHRGKVAAADRRRKLQKAQRAPKWLTSQHLRQIEMFYETAAQLTKETGIKHEVDHIMPLRGRLSSGLHVPWNLQILTAAENRRKSNKV